MTAKAAIWEKRVLDWRASGESAARYSAGRGFSAQGLWRWANRLGLSARRKPKRAATAMRLARVDRAVAPPVPATVIETRVARLHVEVGAVRVAIAPGFGRATLAAIVDALEQRAGERGLR